MTLISWLTLVGICALGAISPGPSLAVILQNRMQHSLRAALIASWAHAAGIFFWALAATTTLGALFHRLPSIKTALSLVGATFLIYLAIKSWGSQRLAERKANPQLPAAWLSGLSISLLNPKIFVFFTALFSQFIPDGAGLVTLLGMAMVAFVVDGVWYSIASLLVGPIGLEKVLRQHNLLINRACAGLYLLIAGLTLFQMTGLTVAMVR